MTNPFETQDMAAGYAAARPPVHPRVLADYFRRRDRAQACGRALDLGCGAGLSTRALEPFVDQCIGLEPALSMLRWASEVAPRARFAVAVAEALPLRDHSVDLVTAAGSLNYVRDLHRCFAEVRRVLTTQGVLLVYDFAAGRRFHDDAGLDEWFAAFTGRYPYPPSEARPLSPDILADVARGLAVRRSAPFTVALTMQPAQYGAYVMTETNVAAAVRSGTSLAAIRTWVNETLAPAWGDGERAVLFDGYWAELVSQAADVSSRDLSS
jgi:ubiquinone/menaquinone biosynthesis C-methylase UbiE